MAPFVRSLTAAIVASLAVASAALATDRRIDGLRLVLKRVGTATKLTFVSRDPSFLFPPVGGADDPATGSPGGAVIEVFSHTEGAASVTAPVGSGTPGWTVAPGPTPVYRFRNREAPAGISPMRVAVLRAGKTLKLAAADIGLPLAVAQQSVGIRITTGTLRSCARFAGSAIRRDVPNVFVGSHAAGDDIPDCSDDYLSGSPSACELSQGPACGAPCPGDGACVPTLNGCACVYPTQPCGDTSPVCGGTCPAGEECAAVGPGPFPRCLCLPTGSTPCGDPGAPVCGGACPSGTACRAVMAPPIFGGALGCDCRAPGPCGTSGSADCGNGFACASVPFTPTCVPIPCGGGATYPACADGAACGSGGVCQALKVNSEFNDCLCAVPAACDGACGGYTCPSGEVCGAQSGACSCGAP